MRVLLTVIFALSFLLQASAISQTSWYVDDDNSSGPWEGTQEHPFFLIQDGIDIAFDGDSVLVLPGTYVENINFLGKAITLKSSEGPDVTFIDGSNPLNPDLGSVVVFENGEGLESVIDGFTIQGGSGSLLQEYNDYCGGGVLCYYSSPTIMNNTILANSASKKGGGICCEHASPAIISNLILENSAGSGGGGIHSKYYFPIIDGNIISGNTAIYGSGIYCSSSTPDIKNNILHNNAATSGGGIACYDASPLLMNNTLCGNFADEMGGGMYLRVRSYPEVKNTILWNNEAVLGPEVSIISRAGLTISYSDLEGGAAMVYTEPGSTLLTGLGMKNSDPLFADFTALSLHLLGGSPCVDAGDPDSEMIEGTTRTDGMQDEGIVDMGFHYKLGSEVIEAEVYLCPRIINLKNWGWWLICLIELPEGYCVEDIDVSSVRLEDSLCAKNWRNRIFDCDRDELPELLVLFKRWELIHYLKDLQMELPAYVELTVSGMLYDGTAFEGKRTIRVVSRGGWWWK